MRFRSVVALLSCLVSLVLLNATFAQGSVGPKNVTPTAPVLTASESGGEVSAPPEEPEAQADLPGAKDPWADSDNDGSPNWQDIDDDDDGVFDNADPKPYDPTIPKGSPTPDPGNPDGDFDGDGAPNWQDVDDDNDGLVDELDSAPYDPNLPLKTPTPGIVDPESDWDGDGLTNNLDPDDDNDGVFDNVDEDPFDPEVPRYTPTPGIVDPQADSDGDGLANNLDPDDDNDGIFDNRDSHPFDPTMPEFTPTPNIVDPLADSDGDGLTNNIDPDDDNDGILDNEDCAPFDPGPCVTRRFGSVGPGGTGGNPPGDLPAYGSGGSTITSLPNTGAEQTSGSEIGLVALLLAGLSLVLVAARLAARGRQSRSA